MNCPADRRTATAPIAAGASHGACTPTTGGTAATSRTESTSFPQPNRTASQTGRSARRCGSRPKPEPKPSPRKPWPRPRSKTTKTRAPAPAPRKRKPQPQRRRETEHRKPSQQRATSKSKPRSNYRHRWRSSRHPSQYEAGPADPGQRRNNARAAMRLSVHAHVRLGVYASGHTGRLTRTIPRLLDALPVETSAPGAPMTQRARCRCGTAQTTVRGLFCVERSLYCWDCGRETLLPLKRYEHQVRGERVLFRSETQAPGPD